MKLRVLYLILKDFLISILTSRLIYSVFDKMVFCSESSYSWICEVHTEMGQEFLLILGDMSYFSLQKWQCLNTLSVYSFTLDHSNTLLCRRKNFNFTQTQQFSPSCKFIIDFIYLLQMVSERLESCLNSNISFQVGAMFKPYMVLANFISIFFHPFY